MGAGSRCVVEIDHAGSLPRKTTVAPDLVPEAEDFATALFDAAALSTAAEPNVKVAARGQAQLSEKLLDAKVRLHHRLIEEINLSALEKMPDEQVRKHVIRAGHRNISWPSA